MIMRITIWIGMCLATALFLGGCSGKPKEPAALGLIEQGNRYVGDQSKDKVVQIRSEKSVGGTTPTIWYVVYYDSTATFHAVEVKFGAGQMLDVKRPMRVLEMVTGGDQTLDADKLKVDSDRAIKTALQEPLLAKLKVTATQLWLRRAGKGGVGDAAESDPVWRVKLWAQKLRDPTEDADIGDVYLSAESGKVLKADLHINSVD